MFLLEGKRDKGILSTEELSDDSSVVVGKAIFYK